MPFARITSKGRLAVPKPIREHLGVQPGDQLDFLVREDGEVVVVRAATLDVRQLKGLLYRPGRKPVSLGQRDQAIRQRTRRTRGSSR